MDLVKAEILWSRKCPLRCSFCAMPRNDVPKVDPVFMIGGLYRLKDLGCEFVAIYGASPLCDMDGLALYIQTAEELGISTTVITDGILPRHKDKLQRLYDSGLRSLTVSYDFVPYDKHSRRKSERALDLLEWWTKKPDIRDAEIVTTVTALNWRAVLKDVRAATLDGKIWLSFDIIHPDRGNPGTKCRGDGKGFLMMKESVRQFCKSVLELPSSIKVHQSRRLLEFAVEHPGVVSEFQWMCCNDQFPSWVTIDADGSVLPCDDFWTNRNWKVWDLDREQFESFARFYKREVRQKCRGCFWTTHFDAWLIKSGQGSLDAYVHRGS